MGFNSLIFICNDAIGEIEKDPVGWWKATWNALSHPGELPKEYGFGNHANGFMAVSNMHADGTVLVAAGGNHATVLDVSGFDHHTPEFQRSILEAAAAKLGYRLTRKTKSALAEDIDRAEYELAEKRTYVNYKRREREEARIAWLKKLAGMSPDPGAEPT